MPDPTCKTCKWMAGCTCTNPKLASMDNDGMVAGSVEVVLSEVTTTSDDIGPQSVGPDFYCIHHEAKGGA